MQTTAGIVLFFLVASIAVDNSVAARVASLRRISMIVTVALSFGNTAVISPGQNAIILGDNPIIGVGKK